MVSTLGEQAHEYGLDRLALVEQRLCPDLEAADLLGPHILFLEQIVNACKAYRINVFSIADARHGCLSEADGVLASRHLVIRFEVLLGHVGRREVDLHSKNTNILRFFLV